MSYKLIHGDCLEIIPTLELFSCTWVRLPFSFHVASVAKANKIREFVSLPIIIEVSKSNNMMNIKFFTNFHLSNSAYPTSVVVPFTSESFLSRPVSPIVASIIAATPVFMIFATIPHTSAIWGAKPKPPRTFLFRWQVYRFTALLARKFQSWLCWWVRYDHPFFSCFCIATLRAERLIRSVFLKWFSNERTLAVVASVLPIYFFFCRPKIIRTLATTSGLSSKLQSFGVGVINFSASRTLFFNHAMIIP